MIDGSKLPKLCRALKMDHHLTPTDGVSKIWLMWKSSISLVLFHSHEQIITVALQEGGVTIAFLSFVYAKCSSRERRELWDQMASLSSAIHLPWLVSGDFNAILYAEEKLGGNPPDRQAMAEFNDALSAANLNIYSQDILVVDILL